MAARTRLGILSAIAVLGVLLTGCASGGDAPTAEDLEGSWALTSASDADGPIELGEASVTLEMESGPGGNGLALGGNAACNSYNGTMTVDPTSVTVGPLSQTMMACDEALMEIESRYLATLAEVNAADVAGDTLTLSGDDSELVYTRASADGEG